MKIGALAREHQLESSEAIKTKFPILADTAKVIADPLVRSQATVCGNLAHGDPANDHPATMLALGATVVATGPKGQREIPIEDFFQLPFSQNPSSAPISKQSSPSPTTASSPLSKATSNPPVSSAPYCLSKLFVLV